MNNDELKNRKNRNVGRPALEDKELMKDRKVMLSFNQAQYDELKRMQKLLNRSTLTATIQYFLDRGKEAVSKDFSRER